MVSRNAIFWLLSKEMCQSEDLHNQGNQYFLISSRTGMAGSSSLSRGWTKGFYVTEDTFTDLASVGVASRKLHNYLERLFPFSLFYLIPLLCEAKFSSPPSTKATYCNRLNLEADRRIHLSPIKLDI